MPLTLEEYKCLESFSVLYSGGLDSCAVAYDGKLIRAVSIYTYMHNYGTFFNEWSRKHEDLRGFWVTEFITTSST